MGTPATTTTTQEPTTTTTKAPTTTSTEAPAECADEVFTDAVITCDPSQMVISISKCAFENSKVDFSKTYLAGQSPTTQLAGDDTNSCVGVENGANIDFSIVDDMSACGMETVKNGTHTVYKNAVQCTHGTSNAIISR